MSDELISSDAITSLSKRFILPFYDEVYSNSPFFKMPEPRRPIYGPPTPSIQLGDACTFSLDDWMERKAGEFMVEGHGYEAESDVLDKAEAQEIIDWLNAWIIHPERATDG